MEFLTRIVKEAEKCIDLYKCGKEAGEKYYQNNPKAAYNLYWHNCDTVAAKILGIVDCGFEFYPNFGLDLTPNQKYCSRMKFLDNSWEEIIIGKNNLWEFCIGRGAVSSYMNYWKELIELKIKDLWKTECEV